MWRTCNILFVCLIGLLQNVYGLPPALEQDTAITDSVNLQAFQTMQVIKSDTNTRYILVGNVILSADSNLFFCDSLIFDSDIDSGIIRAYDNIQVKTVDGVIISSDSLVYSLQSSAGRFLGNCTYIEANKRIESPFISFNTQSGEGSFAGGGTLQQEGTRIRSNYGNYSSRGGASRLAGNVEVEQEDTYIKSKELIYNAQTGEGKVLDSTVIYKENLTIYCHEGDLGGPSNVSRFGQQTLFVTEHNIGWSDKTEYHPKDSSMTFLSTFHIYNTIDSVGMWGIHAMFDEKSGRIKGYNRPMVYLIDGLDTSYFCADTLFSINGEAIDESGLSTGRRLRGWGQSKFYTPQEQGQSDSIKWFGGEGYSKLDGRVVLWNDSVEVLADHSIMETLDHETDYKKITFYDRAFWSKVVVDSVLADQVSGDSILLFVKEAKTEKIEVIGNVKVLVFPKTQKDGSHENGNLCKAEYAVVTLDSLGEVISLRVEKNIEGEAFSLAGNNFPQHLAEFRTERSNRPSSFIDLSSQPNIPPISPLWLYKQHLIQWGE